MTNSTRDTNPAPMTCYVSAQRFTATRAFAVGSVASNANSSPSGPLCLDFSILGQGTSQTPRAALNIGECGSWRTRCVRKNDRFSPHACSRESSFAFASATQNADTTAGNTSKQNATPRSKNFSNASGRSFRVFDLPSYQSGNHRIKQSTNQGRHLATSNVARTYRASVQEKRLPLFNAWERG
jgi:hypothetical protein